METKLFNAMDEAWSEFRKSLKKNGFTAHMPHIHYVISYDKVMGVTGTIKLDNDITIHVKPTPIEINND